MNKQIILSGSFSTGKSSLLKKAKESFGDSLHYVEDGARSVMHKYLEGGSLSAVPLNKIKNLQEDMIDYYINSEKNRPVDKITISDGSLAEVIAYSKGVLSEDVCALLNCLLREQTRSSVFAVLKLPVGTFPIERDGERHTDEAFQRIVDQRIDTVWSDKESAQIISVQKEVDGVLDRFHYLYRMITNLQKSNSIFEHIK